MGVGLPVESRVIKKMRSVRLEGSSLAISERKSGSDAIFKGEEYCMKMKQEHFDHMKKVIDEYLASIPLDEHIKNYKDAGNSKIRFQWDVLYAVKLNDFVRDELYPYLNDTHIQTALNKIIKDY